MIKQRGIYVLAILIGFLLAVLFLGTSVLLDFIGRPPHAVGDVISFGGHNWRVLDVQDDRALLLSEQILEQRAFDDASSLERITWETSSLRYYLNNEFINNTFTNEERVRIAETRLFNNPNSWFESDYGGVTYDMIFLLSINEVIQYFGDSGMFASRESNIPGVMGRRIFSDRYNNARVATWEGDQPFIWLLRSPGQASGGQRSYVTHVNEAGHIVVEGVPLIVSNGGIRPAFWLYF